MLTLHGKMLTCAMNDSGRLLCIVISVFLGMQDPIRRLCSSWLDKNGARQASPILTGLFLDTAFIDSVTADLIFSGEGKPWGKHVFSSIVAP
jgi:hypothetical protein